MKNIDNILNELAAKLLSEGSVEFNENGLNIKATYTDNGFSIETSYVSPTKDEAEELVESFEEYITSLSDEFFLETTESFESGDLKKIQDKINSKNINLVKAGINEFMHNLKAIASNKIEEISKDIAKTEKELSDLIEIRDSYEHVLNKKF